MLGFGWIRRIRRMRLFACHLAFRFVLFGHTKTDVLLSVLKKATLFGRNPTKVAVEAKVQWRLALDHLGMDGGLADSYQQIHHGRLMVGRGTVERSVAPLVGCVSFNAALAEQQLHHGIAPM